jgi:hypothetical protein
MDICCAGVVEYRQVQWVYAALPDVWSLCEEAARTAATCALQINDCSWVMHCASLASVMVGAYSLHVASRGGSLQGLE